ncbi:MAG: hypothetical protein WC667_09060 [Sulfurimonas sp.]|jgi:hypothetical protein
MKKIALFKPKKREIEVSRLVELFCGGAQTKPIPRAALKRFRKVNQFIVSEISALRYIKFTELRHV